MSTIGKQRVAVGPFRLVIQYRIYVEKGRSLGQIEDAVEIVCRIELLNTQHWKILSDAMAKNRAERTHVERTAVPEPDYRFLVCLVGDSEARRQIGEAILDVAVERSPIDAGNRDLASVQINPPSLAGASYRLRIIDLPA